MLCGPVLAPSMRDMFTQFGANKPLLTPLIWVYCLKPPFMQRRRVFQEVERWEFHRDQTSAMLHPHPFVQQHSFGSGMHFSRNTTLECFLLSTPGGKWENLFLLVPRVQTNFSFTKSPLLEPDFHFVARRRWKRWTHSGRWVPRRLDARWKVLFISSNLPSLCFIRRDDLHWPPPKSTAVSGKVISSNTLHQSVKLLWVELCLELRQFQRLIDLLKTIISPSCLF